MELSSFNSFRTQSTAEQDARIQFEKYGSDGEKLLISFKMVELSLVQKTHNTIHFYVQCRLSCGEKIDVNIERE